MRPIIAVLLCMVLAASLPVASTQMDGDETEEDKITILSYNDVQTAAAENKTLPRMAHLIDKRKEANQNPVVVVGGGDQVSPHALSPVTRWHTPIEALNHIDPVADVVGNHDLDYGIGAVGNFSRASEFPWLMANIVDTETGETIPGTKPYHVTEAGDFRIGVIGLADEKIKSKTTVDFEVEGYELLDYAEVGSEYATMLKRDKDVDVVVAAAHLGVPVAKELANRTENIDVVVVGDDEIEYPPQETGGAIIMEAEGRANHIAELNLTVGNDGVSSWNGRLLNVTENTTKDRGVSEVISQDRGEVLNKRIGVTETPLDARFSSNYHRETGMGNLITDAFRAKTGADIAITNAGGIRSNSVYGPGNLTVGDVYNVLPFRNRLVTFRLTGSEVEELLAGQVIPLESEEGKQYGAEAALQVSGLSYEWFGHENVSEKNVVRDIRVGGEPIEDGSTYTVTVNSYMAGWDDSVFTNATEVSRSQDLYGAAVVEYIEERERIGPQRENRIRRVDSYLGTRSATLDREGEVTVNFTAPNSATEIQPDTFYSLGTGVRVNATTATLSNDILSVSFNETDLTEGVSGDTLIEVYGKYSDGRHQRVYFNHSVINGEIEASVSESGDTSETESTEDESMTESNLNAGANETSTEEPSGPDSTTPQAPGFGLLASVVGILVVLFVRERD